MTMRVQRQSVYQHHADCAVGSGTGDEHARAEMEEHNKIQF